MRSFVLFLLPALCWPASIPLDQLITMARSAPPEFAAEALIRIADLDQVARERKIGLLEDAFQRAASAPIPYKRRPSIVQVAGPAGFYNRAASQELDAMSLRLKVVRAMLQLDTARARAMFLRIPPIKLPQLKCEEFMVYDLDAFYDVLEHVSRESFTPAEVEKGEPFQLIQPYIAAISSPVQLPGAARLIAASNFSDADFESLVSQFGKNMVKIMGDDRSFTFAAAGPQIRAIVQAAEKRKMPTAPLLEAYRLYIVNNMSGNRCADDDMMVNQGTSFAFADPRGVEKQGPDPAAYFNDHLRVPPFQEIKPNEVAPLKVEGVASGLRGCEDEICKAMVQQYNALIFDQDRAAYPVAHRDTDEWKKQAADLLTAMAEWKSASPLAAPAHFRDKTSLYSDLANLQPNATARLQVLRAELTYVVKDKAAAQNREQWFLPINGMIGRVTLDPMGLAPLKDDLAKTNDPVVALFTELESLAPRRPDQIMPLF